MRPTLGWVAVRVGAASCPEEPLYVSTIRDSVICPACQLSQLERGNGKCRRCHHSLGVTYCELFLPTSIPSIDLQRPGLIRKEIGGLIRRLRSRRDITQSALASLTGIHRTYLSRAEHGQVMPSVVALMRIARALNVDEIVLRVLEPSR